MTQTGRNHAFDNLRTLMVLFIVLLHTACAYTTGIPWWHAQDAKSQVFDVAIVIIDTFALPVLFFIAGLFARPTFEKHGGAGFVRNKLRRFGIPLLFLPVFYLPTMVYVGYVGRTAAPMDFIQYWLNWVASLGDWSFAVITNMEEGARYTDLMSPHHLWFLSLLLIFFLGYAALRRAFNSSITIGMTTLIGFVGLGILIGYTALNFAIQDWAWARFGPFILFQPTRVAVYFGMFLFGVLAHPHMDRLRPFPGPWWGWMILFLCAQVIFLAMVTTLMAPGQTSLPLAIIHGVLRTVLAISATGLWVNLAVMRFGGPSRWRESLAASSYDIFLWHMPVVVFVQASLVPTTLPLAIKALLVFLVPVVLFWFLKQGAARISPWQWGGFIAMVFLGFCLGAA